MLWSTVSVYKKLESVTKKLISDKDAECVELFVNILIFAKYGPVQEPQRAKLRNRN